MKYETAGDPVSGLRWTRKTTEKIADELLALDIRVSRKTDVSRGPWKKNGALHSVIRVSDQAATSACSRTSLRRW